MFCRQVMSLPSASRTGSQPSATSCAGSRRSKNPAVRIVAGLALEKVTGQGYREYVVEHVFGPASRYPTLQYRQPSPGAKLGALCTNCGRKSTVSVTE